MFCVQLAGIVIEIDNRYEHIHRICKDYIVEGKEPSFTVHVTGEEILAEQNGDTFFSKGFYEGECLYCKMCAGLAQYGGFLMHGAVVAVDGEAYIFTAPSGTGKTTHMRLWLDRFGDRAEVVNGDKPILRFIGDTLYACGTPWQGEENYGNPIMRPVRAVCFLEQAKENCIRRLNMHDISDRIFRQVWMPKDQRSFDFFWPLLDRFVTTTDFYLLRCNRDPEAARLSYETMRRR